MSKQRLPLLALAVLFAGCGDDDTSTPDSAGLDASTDARDASGDADTRDAMPDADVGCVVEERMWQPFILDFTGPNASESDSSPNPFTDHRLTVTFESPSGTVMAVPGYFDGDGLGGSSGDVHRVRFTANEPGEWTWTAAFVTGDGVALDADLSGTATAPDGETGTVCVGVADASAPGYLGHGRLSYVDSHYLQLGGGTYWIKAGADSPENFLGYAGFDDVEDLPGGAGTEGLEDGLHHYAPHVADWNEGDPDWNEGAGKGIIGALNYLASEEVNSIYFLPCNLEGDGRDTHPYVTPDDLLHIDLSRLAQWEMVFAHAERLGIALHVVLHETENGNENLHDEGSLGPERKLYYRELVARFAHHNALFWNIGEENDYGPDRQREFAGYIDGLDVYDHPTTVHTHVNRPADQYDALVGDPLFDLTSIQLSPDRAGEFTEAWRTESAGAGRPWAVMLDEIAPAGVGVTDMNAAEIRRLTLWPALLSGAAGVEWYFGYHALPLGGDVRVEDFRTREEMWRYTRFARHFLEDNLPFWEMEPRDALLRGTGEVFAKDGAVYAVYLPAGDATLDLGTATGSLELRWFDPSTGEFAGDATTVDPSSPITLSPPSGADWVALLEGTVTPGESPECDYRAVDGIVAFEAEDLPHSGDWRVATDADASGGAYLEWAGSPSLPRPSGEPLSVDIEISEPGLYRLQVRNEVGFGTSATDHNDTWMRFGDADAYYGSQGSAPTEDRVYPRPLCEDGSFIASIEAMSGVSEASCPAGASGDGYFKVYSSGALMWRWSAFTSDSDAHRIVVRFDAPGVYRFDLSARSDFHRLDRIVLHRVELADGDVQDDSVGTTPCR